MAEVNAPVIGGLELTRRVLVDSLRSSTCPLCGGKKRYAQTFCRSDYYRLPREMQLALYAGVGRGYDAAVHAAFEYLGVTTFRTAGEAQAPR